MNDDCGVEPDGDVMSLFICIDACAVMELAAVLKDRSKPVPLLGGDGISGSGHAQDHASIVASSQRLIGVIRYPIHTLAGLYSHVHSTRIPGQHPRMLPVSTSHHRQHLSPPTRLAQPVLLAHPHHRPEHHKQHPEQHQRPQHHNPPYGQFGYVDIAVFKNLLASTSLGTPSNPNNFPCTCHTGSPFRNIAHVSNARYAINWGSDTYQPCARIRDRNTMSVFDNGGNGVGNTDGITSGTGTGAGAGAGVCTTTVVTVTGGGRGNGEAASTSVVVVGVAATTTVGRSGTSTHTRYPNTPTTATSDNDNPTAAVVIQNGRSDPASINSELIVGSSTDQA
ncbi:hypothetical protein Henu3_gp42 [Mycobacterium phage Henu3 PeY-2017]|nr:hypothetical protein Henu3_gp42 [Mycobacterium phage Henu3 PeY-2017]